MRTVSKLWVVAALCALVGGLAACSNEDSDSAGDDTAETTATDETGAAGSNASSATDTSDDAADTETNDTSASEMNDDPATTQDSSDSEMNDGPAMGDTSDSAMDGDPAVDDTGADTSDPATPFADLPANCRGLDVEGLTHSPGGSVLPNTCAPYDGFLNNPFAIRCIEADPDYDTGFPGDDYCILPPEPELGTQVRVSPESYENPSDWHLMGPGEEHNDFFYSNATNEEEHFFYRVNLRMRAGSHHMINRMLDADREDGPGIGGGFGGGGGSRGFPGAQRPDQDRPMSLEVPMENANLGNRLMANQQFSFNLHHFNFGETDLLREVWVNIWYKPESEVTEELQSISIFGNPADLNIPPGEHRELHYSCNVDAATRIVRINGHRHSSTDRFGIWIERADGETVSVYESFEYADMPTYQFDSSTQNPAPQPEAKIDGGYTGVLEADAGDELHFVCDVTNRGSQSLRFANEVDTGEMCIVFGSRTGGSLCRTATRVQ